MRVHVQIRRYETNKWGNYIELWDEKESVLAEQMQVQFSLEWPIWSSWSLASCVLFTGQKWNESATCQCAMRDNYHRACFDWWDSFTMSALVCLVWQTYVPIFKQTHCGLWLGGSKLTRDIILLTMKLTKYRQIKGWRYKSLIIVLLERPSETVLHVAR